MDEIIEDTNLDPYMDGTIVQEIEHLLVMRLHDQNTIDEIEVLKRQIFDSMSAMYDRARARIEKTNEIVEQIYNES